MRILIALLCLSCFASLQAADDGFINVDVLTLRSVLAGGVAAYESPDAFLHSEKPITHLPDLSIATLISWIRDKESGLAIAARVSVPQHDRYRIYVIACGDIARRETVRLRQPGSID